MKLFFVACIILRVIAGPIPPATPANSDAEESWDYSELICDECEKDLDDVDRYYALSCHHVLCVNCFKYRSFIDGMCSVCGVNFITQEVVRPNDLFEN